MILTFRDVTEDTEGEGCIRFLERARSLIGRAEVMGAKLVAWSSRTISVAFDVTAIDSAIAVAVDALQGEQRTWACGLASGAVETATWVGGRAEVGTGPALHRAEELARIAPRGALVVALDLPSKFLEQLTPMRKHRGRVGGRSVVGLSVDPSQPWKADGAIHVERMVEPPMVGIDRIASVLADRKGVTVILAEPGCGGSRFLKEVALAVMPCPSLHVVPVGAGLEPLGALRIAFARFVEEFPERLSLSDLAVVEQLLQGRGMAMDVAVTVLTHMFRVEVGEWPGALLIDDVGGVDDETLTVCARAFEKARLNLRLVVRTDSSGELPAPLEHLPRGDSFEIKPFGSRDAEAFAASVLRGALSDVAQVRWARRSHGVPLAVVHGIAAALEDGELVWKGQRAAPRTRTAGKGRAKSAAELVLRRMNALEEDPGAILRALAILGGIAPQSLVLQLLSKMHIEVAMEPAIKALRARGWIADGWPGASTADELLALASSTVQRTVVGAMSPEMSRDWNLAACEAMESSALSLQRADAFRYASRARAYPRQADLLDGLLESARHAQLGPSAERLAYFADSLAATVGHSRESVLPSSAHAQDFDGADSVIPITLPGTRYPQLDAAASEGATGAGRAVVFAPGDESLERDDLLQASLRFPLNKDWQPSEVHTTEAEVVLADAQGGDSVPEPNTETPPATAMQPDMPLSLAAAAVPKGLAAIAVPGEKVERRSQTTGLQCHAALGRAQAFASEGQWAEALFEGLYALARAREGDDDANVDTTLGFLASVFASQGLLDEAHRLELASRRTEDERRRPPY